MAAAAVLSVRSIFQCPSSFPFNKELKLRNPVLSLTLTEIADKSTPFSLTTSNGNSRGSNPMKSSALGRNKGNSSNQEELIALFRRIQSSISNGETGSAKTKTFRSSKNKSAAESILDVLHGQKETRTKKGGKASGVTKKRQGKKAAAAMQDVKLSRLPSNFVKQSPIPHPTVPRGKNIELNNEVIAQDFKLSRLPSNFVKKSPIPHPTVPRGKNIELNNEMVAQDFKLSRLPSNFVKTSPIPYPTVPRGNNPSNEETKVANLEKLKLAELKELAKAKGIKGYSSLKKSELVQLLRS